MHEVRGPVDNLLALDWEKLHPSTRARNRATLAHSLIFPDPSCSFSSITSLVDSDSDQILRDSVNRQITGSEDAPGFLQNIVWSASELLTPDRHNVVFFAIVEAPD